MADVPGHTVIEFGTPLELGDAETNSTQKVRVLEGELVSPSALEPRVLHEIEGLVAWIGTIDESNRVRDAIPVFVPAPAIPLTATRAGIVLLCDIVRDFVLESRLAQNNFSIGHVDDLDAHIRHTYGAMAAQYLAQEFLNKPLGVANARFFAKRLARVLRANYPLAGSAIVQDKGRIVLERPFTTLTKFATTKKFTTSAALAIWLGAHFLEAEHDLLLRRPELADRSAYFGDTNHAA